MVWDSGTERHQEDNLINGIKSKSHPWEKIRQYSRPQSLAEM